MGSSLGHVWIILRGRWGHLGVQLEIKIVLRDPGKLTTALTSNVQLGDGSIMSLLCFDYTLPVLFSSEWSEGMVSWINMFQLVGPASEAQKGAGGKPNLERKDC